MKKFNSLFLVVCLTLTLVLPSNVVLAAENKTEDFKDMSITELQEQFSKMSNEELNQYITNVYEESKSTTGTSRYTAVQNAWLAAATIAKNAGYPCAGTLVQYSVQNKSYTETSGTFSKKIKATPVYKNWARKPSLAKSISFEKSDDSDLFYALHAVNISANGNSQGAKVTVTDTFDFAYDNNMGSLFTNLVNNWAWLCQQTGVLHKIPVSIYFYA